MTREGLWTMSNQGEWTPFHSVLAAGQAMATALADEHTPDAESDCWKCAALGKWLKVGMTIRTDNGEVWKPGEGWVIDEERP